MSIERRALGAAAGAILALTAMSSVSACGDGEPAPAALTPITVWVVDAPLALGDTERPIAGALVAFDPPGGGARIEKTTDADGRVAFEADFTQGGAAVSAVSEEHALSTKLDVRPATIAARPNESGKPAGDLVIVLPRFDAARGSASVALTGKILGKRDPASLVDLSASGQKRKGSTITSEATYALDVPRGRPFFLLGHESKKVENTFSVVTNDLLGSFRIDVPARDADGALDVDITKATALPLRTKQVRIVVPRGPGSPFGDDSRASAIVVGSDSQLLLGPVRKVVRSGDGSAFDAEMGLVDVDIAPERPLTRASITAGDGSRSIRIEPGIAADGATFTDFLLPPTVVEASRSLADAIPLDGVPKGADLRIDVYAAGQLLWVLESPPGGLASPTLKLPAPAGIVLSTDVQVFGLALNALVDPIPLSSSTKVYRRSSVSREILVRRR
ncbi:MAG: hypothetical protein JST00_04080 [Deltaproteobacteria bacterium]|nr:hypothetical protein [Deltaproteobacteria bacterium]